MTELTTAAGPASTLLDRLGGRRGLIEGAIPPLVFAAANAAGGMAGLGDRTLLVALGAAVASALVVMATGLLQGVSLAGALRGSALLAAAAGFVLWTGSARDFFLPGMFVDATYTVVLGISALVRRPIVGYAYAFVFGTGGGWRDDPRQRRAFAVATLLWSATYGVRTAAQVWLYRADQPELLGVAKVLLGWPLTALAVVGTVVLVRRTRPERSALS